jgi:hypothetical protein
VTAKLLLVLANTLIALSESDGAHEHIVTCYATEDAVRIVDPFITIPDYT